jgi:hypothetical protein
MEHLPLSKSLIECLGRFINAYGGEAWTITDRLKIFRQGLAKAVAS